MFGKLIDLLHMFEGRLTNGLSRRSVAGLSLAGLLAVTSAESGAAKHKGKQKKSCPKKRAKFPCIKFTHNHCRKTKRPDGTRCPQDGRCHNGFCFTPPTCQGVQGSICMTGDECCSGECASGACAPGAAGALCAVSGDCLSGECVGFHCT